MKTQAGSYEQKLQKQAERSLDIIGDVLNGKDGAVSEIKTKVALAVVGARTREKSAENNRLRNVMAAAKMLSSEEIRERVAMAAVESIVPLLLSTSGMAGQDVPKPRGRKKRK